MKNSIFMIYYYFKISLEFLFLSILKEESEFITKITRYTINISKFTYSFSISIFIDKEYIFNHSRFYILDENNFFFEKRKLDKVMKEETKKRGLELEMKSSIGNHSSLSS